MTSQAAATWDGRADWPAQTEDAISAEALSDLIGKIYDCAIDPALWPVAMEAIRLALGFEVSTLNLQRLPSHEVVLNVTNNVPQAYIPLIARAGRDVVEQWGGPERIAAMPFDEPGVLSRTNPSFDPQTTTNRYYLEFARPQGLVDVMAVMLARDAHSLGSIAWGRHARAGPIGEREIGVARLLTPHLQRAATINRLLDLSAGVRESFETVLDSLAIPTLIADAAGRVLHANPAAVRMLAQRDLLHVRHGVLGSPSAGVAAALSAALCAVGEAGPGRGGIEVPARTLAGAVSVLHVLPLRPSSVGGEASASAAVFVGRSSTGMTPRTGLMEALFGLTGGEARVFARIASGASVPAAARELGIAPATVKTHLLRLYQKVGVHRREDLMQVAASLALPLER